MRSVPFAIIRLLEVKEDATAGLPCIYFSCLDLGFALKDGGARG